MKHLVIIFTFCISFVGNIANAESVINLIKEKAVLNYGLQMPSSGEFEIQLFNSSDFDAHFVTNFQMNKNSGKFIADIIKKDGQEIRLGGLAMLMVNIPVPVRRIMPNEIISEADIVEEKILWGRVSAFSILDKNELIGMQSHRLLAQGRPVLENSITPPIVIEKGQKVEILYSDGAMTLTAPGKALDQAYKGKQIKVVNLISNKTLTVIAQNEDIVEISN